MQFSMMLKEDKESKGREAIKAFVKDEETAGAEARALFDRFRSVVHAICDKDGLSKPESLEMLGGLANVLYDKLPPFVRGFVGTFEIPEEFLNLIGVKRGE